jgi:signal transduction histidine kinase/CheY-like chemotaxis protein
MRPDPPSAAAHFAGSEPGAGAIRTLRLLLGASVALPLLLFTVVAWQNWRQLEAEAHASAVKTAAILHEHAAKVFDTQELALDRVDERIRGMSWGEIARSTELHLFLKSFPERFEQISSTLLVDPKGFLATSSRVFPVNPPTYVGDRDYFLAPKAGHPGMFIGEPFVARVSGQPIFNVSRPRSSEAGTFDGVVGVAIFLDYFIKFYRSATSNGEDSITLARADGTILVREPAVTTGARVISPQSGLMRSIAKAEAGTYTTISELDQTERFHAYQKVGRYPIYVSYGFNMGRVARAWSLNLLTYGLLAGLTALGLASATWFALRQAHRQQGTLAALHEEITRRERAEADLVQAQKMEAVGQLTGGVAHDFNNLLMVVLGNLELLRRRLPDDPRLQRLVDNAVQGAQRGATLTQRMLAFARRQELKPEAVDIPMLVQGMSELLQRSLGPRVQVEARFPPQLPLALVDANQLELAILNLAVNARDAMPEGGKLSITAGSGMVEEAEAAGLAPGPYIRLLVTDTGVGMDAETLARAMEPFFTTKGVGKGTGLGLSLVHGVAAQSGGRFVLRSHIGEGTTGEIWLPVADPGIEAQSREIASDLGPAAARSRLRILAVDDDPLVLANTAAMLDDLGHEVQEAASAKQALEILSKGSAVDLVITDYAMPEMTGADLAAGIRRRWPDLPVVLSTGYAELPEGADPGLPRLAKPYTQDELARAIAGVERADS